MNALGHRAAMALRRSCACFGAIALLIAGLSAATADYGLQTIMDGKYHQSSDVTSPDGLSAGPCTNTTTCFFLFEKVPQGLDLFVGRASCSITGGAGAFVILKARKGRGFRPKEWALLPVALGITQSLLNANAPFPIAAGERPVLLWQFFQAGNISGTCSISGDVSAP